MCGYIYRTLRHLNVDSKTAAVSSMIIFLFSEPCLSEICVDYTVCLTQNIDFFAGSNCTLHSLANAVISHILIFVNLIDVYVRFRGFKVAHLEIQIVTSWIIG